jgi:hypothetical protein
LLYPSVSDEKDGEGEDEKLSIKPKTLPELCDVSVVELGVVSAIFFVFSFFEK